MNFLISKDCGVMPELKFARIGALKSVSNIGVTAASKPLSAPARAAATAVAQPKPVQPAAAKMRDMTDIVAAPQSLARPNRVGAVSAENLRVMNPAIWRKIGKVRPAPGNGSTRESLALPVAQGEDFTDATTFEAASGSGKFYIPRYALATRKVSGNEQYIIRIEKAPAGDWIMRVVLAKNRSPGIPADAAELVHDILVRLVYVISLAGGGSTAKELPFQEITEAADKRSITAVLRFASPAERDQALTAITQPSGGAGLKVTRSVRVAIPLGAAAPRLYRPVTRGIDQIADPNPLTLNAAMHPYLFEGQAPQGATPGLVAHQVKWGGRFFTYWQDAVRPELFYYLPDSFRLARRGKPAPFLPIMSIRVEAGSATAEGATITLEFAATPFIDPARMEDARGKLSKHLPAAPKAPKPGGAAPSGQPGSLGGLFGRALGGSIGEVIGAVVDGAMTAGPKAAVDLIVLEPMPVQKAALWLAATGSGLTEQPGAQVEVRAAIYHSMNLPMAQFQAVFDALMGGSVTLMRGEVRLDLGQAKPEIIPLDLRFDRMNGELLLADFARIADEPNAVEVTLGNAIESPIELRKLTGWAVIGDLEYAGDLDGLQLPATVAAGGSRKFRMLFPKALPAGELQLMFDFEDVQAKPEPALMWQAILDPTTPAEYQKTIQVRAVQSMFEPSPDKPNDRVLAILVQFETGGTVELTAAKLEAETKIRMPLAAMVLGSAGPASYRYRSQVIRAGSRQQDNAWREDSFDILFPALPGP
jgi:hypothetical protein